MDPKPSFLGGGAGNLLRPRVTAQLHSRGLGVRKRKAFLYKTGSKEEQLSLYFYSAQQWRRHAVQWGKGGISIMGSCLDLRIAHHGQRRSQGLETKL